MAGRVEQLRRSKRAGGSHAVAGFTLGILAAGTGLLFAGRGGDVAPQAPAAVAAETAAAVVLALDPRATPSAAAPRPVEVAPVAFAEGDELFTVRHATRVVVKSVGIDAQVAPVGLVFRSGALQYDVPRSEAGQYVGSAAPGTAGNTVIGGHVALRGGAGVFASLPGVVAGDIIEVYRGAEVYRYFITEIRVVAADATDVMSQTQDATLTLITCFPDDNYRERLVVVGKLV